MKRFTLFTLIVVLACALLAPATLMASGGHGHGGRGHGGHAFGGHHGFGGHGIHVGLSFGHHNHYSYGYYPHYGYRSYYYPSYYYPSYGYSRSYVYPSDYGYYADSYYCGKPATVYRTSPPVEVAPQPSEPVEPPSVEPAPAPTVVPDESPNQPATQQVQPRVNLVVLRRNEAVEIVSPPVSALGPRLAVPTVRALASDEETPWIAGGDVLVKDDPGRTLATSGPVNDRR